VIDRPRRSHPLSLPEHPEHSEHSAHPREPPWDVYTATGHAGAEPTEAPPRDTPGTILAVVPLARTETLAVVGYLLRTPEGYTSVSWPPCGGLVVDREGRDALVNGTPAGLTCQELELLDFLTSNAGQVFSRDQLLERVWGHSYPGLTRTVDVHVHRLRRKLGPGYAKCLVTVRRVGYRFTPPAA
jgi:Transcriptional regulatory protein, C terminal